jgi:hypothetical protein
MKILTSPEKAIAEAKKEKNIVKSVGILVAAAILLAIAALVGITPIPMLARFGAESAVGVFILVIVGGLFLGWIVKTAMITLGGTGKYFEGLTVVAYSALPISIGVLIAAIVSSIQVIGVVISFVALAFFGVLGIAIMYRSIKDFFKTDMITALVGVSVIYLAIAIAVYGSAVWGLKGLLPTTLG